MQHEWNKIEVPSNLGDLSKGLQSYLDNMKSQLEAESKKVQHLLDLVLIELQNQVNQNK